MKVFLYEHELSLAACTLTNFKTIFLGAEGEGFKGLLSAARQS